MTAGACELCGEWRELRHRITLAREAPVGARAARRFLLVDVELCLSCADDLEHALAERIPPPLQKAAAA